MNLLPANLQEQLVEDSAMVDFSVPVPGQVEVGPTPHSADGRLVNFLGDDQHCLFINPICQREIQEPC